MPSFTKKIKSIFSFHNSDSYNVDRATVEELCVPARGVAGGGPVVVGTAGVSSVSGIGMIGAPPQPSSSSFQNSSASPNNQWVAVATKPPDKKLAKRKV